MKSLYKQLNNELDKMEKELNPKDGAMDDIIVKRIILDFSRDNNVGFKMELHPAIYTRADAIKKHLPPYD